LINNILPWAVGAVTLALVGMLATIGFSIWRRMQFINQIHETAHGYTLVPSPQGGLAVVSRQLPAPSERPLLPAPETYQPQVPRTIDLPQRLPNGRIGIGAGQSQALWFTQSELSAMLIVGNKGSGKSSFLRMLAYQAAQHGWKLWLLDAEMLTFDPDVWDDVASAGVAQSDTDVLNLLDEVRADKPAILCGRFRRLQPGRNAIWNADQTADDASVG